MKTIDATAKNTYDEVPYQSFPYAQSQPENLRTLGMLFNMTPPAVETARVLELGCAEGGNLIPHALRYPKAEFVGVDLSKIQIDAGKVHLKELGLKNIELKNCSITDIDESFGKFDYIICHGVISWVPDFVRDKIFEVASKNLSENGIAYISYNTLPGWNMVRTIRDMMLYHSQNFNTPQEKIAQSRLLLDFVKESLEGQDTPYANILRHESQMLSNQSDHYLRHDHLEEENKQFYFSEFMNEAYKYQLQYLSDCSLSSMYVGNLPKNAAEKLQGINDIVRTEQYMDFITNRRFRSTLLCHASVKLNRALNNNDIKKFAMTLTVTPEKPLKDVKLDSNESIKFFLNNSTDANIATSSPALKAILYSFAENTNNPITFDMVVDQSVAKLGASFKSQIEAELLNNAMNIVIKGYMNIYSHPGNLEKIKTDKPCVSKIAMYQVTKTNHNWVTNNLHSPVAINALDKYALQHLNGKNNKEAVVNLLLKDAKEGKISLNKEGRVLDKEAEMVSELELYYDSLIQRMLQNAVLV